MLSISLKKSFIQKQNPKGDKFKMEIIKNQVQKLVGLKPVKVASNNIGIVFRTGFFTCVMYFLLNHIVKLVYFKI